MYILFLAPEILHYEPIDLTTDMWSIGILSYVMLTGKKMQSIIKVTFKFRN